MTQQRALDRESEQPTPWLIEPEHPKVRVLLRRRRANPMARVLLVAGERRLVWVPSNASTMRPMSLHLTDEQSVPIGDVLLKHGAFSGWRLSVRLIEHIEHLLGTEWYGPSLNRREIALGRTLRWEAKVRLVSTDKGGAEHVEQGNESRVVGRSYGAEQLFGGGGAYDASW